jgi:hypothetical protein
VLFADRRVTDFFEQGQGRIDDARAGAIALADALLERLDDFVTIARLLLDKRHDHQAQVAVVEDALAVAFASAAPMASVFVAKMVDVTIFIAQGVYVVAPV